MYHANIANKNGGVTTDLNLAWSQGLLTSVWIGLWKHKAPYSQNCRLFEDSCWDGLRLLTCFSEVVGRDHTLQPNPKAGPAVILHAVSCLEGEVNDKKQTQEGIKKSVLRVCLLGSHILLVTQPEDTHPDKISIKTTPLIGQIMVGATLHQDLNRTLAWCLGVDVHLLKPTRRT